MLACKRMSAYPRTAAFPFQPAAPPPVMHGRQADAALYPGISLAGESPLCPRVVVELEVCRVAPVSLDIDHET
jgi:hypothetical protein